MNMCSTKCDYSRWLRVVCLPAYAFFVILAVQMAGSEELFFCFLRDWKIVVFFSLMAVMAHLSHELKVAIEDYVPNPTTRAKTIKALYCISFVSVLIISITLWRI